MGEQEYTATDLGLEDSVVAQGLEDSVTENFIDPEDDRANWPIIRIDSEEGKPNYETVIVAGTKKDGTPFTHNLQIRRGDEVAVPPSAVSALRSAVETHIKLGKNAQTGERIQIRSNRSAVPWQLVKGGKYC